MIVGRGSAIASQKIGRLGLGLERMDGHRMLASYSARFAP
jgi:hypothetical protein